MISSSVLSRNRLIDKAEKFDLKRFVLETLTLLTTGLILYYFASTATENLVDQGIASGFGFLHQEAGYAIGETWITYSPSDTYARALLAGFLNTLYVTAIAIVFTTIIGALIGIARASPHWLLSRLSAGYVEIFRNTPLLLQVMFWIALMRQLPSPRQAYNPVTGLFLTNRGIIHTVPVLNDYLYSLILAFIAGIVLATGYALWRRKRLYASGRSLPFITIVLPLIIVPPVLVWLLGSSSLEFEQPVLKGFNFVGGLTYSPEFLALVLGLVAYTSAFVAEIVRSGIQSVDAGQKDAARSLGLRGSLILRLVILPQALRVVVPPMTNQYVNIAKDSSLAVAIGYPDLVSVGNTAINQTGQAIEILFLMMIVYVGISASVALIMNRYNKRIALVEKP